MVSPGVGELQLPPLEQHDRNVNSTVAGGDDALTHAIEIRRIEFGQVEFRLVIAGRAGAGTHPGMQLAKLDHAFGLCIGPLRRLPTPQTEKIMVMRDQEIQVTVVIKLWRRIVAGRKTMPVVLEVMPVVRPGEIDRLA